MALWTRNRNTASTNRIRQFGVITLSVGLFATLAIPAYAASTDDVSFRNVSALARANAQSVEVQASASVADISSENYTSQSSSQARVEAAAAMSAYAAAYSGPSVAQLLANPPYSSYDGDSIYSTALSYQGTPYVYGGESPAGFDCSGYVMYVYAQHGIALPHSASGQAALGTRISEADARPGDLVIMAGHDGFWAGPGLILHSPFPGASVRIQSIWTSYTIVRLGI